MRHDVLCNAMVERAGLIKDLSHAIHIDPMPNTNESLDRLMDYIDGIAREYHDDGDQMIEACTCRERRTMQDAYGNEFDPQRGDRVVMVANVGTGMESRTTVLGSQGTVAFVDPTYDALTVDWDDGRFGRVAPYMVTEDDEMPRDNPAAYARAEAYNRSR